MKRIAKSVTASFMIIVIFALSIITVLAASYDPIQNVSYSYSEKGNCTVDYGGTIYYSSAYLTTCRFTVNGRIATCVWATNPTPNKGTYSNITKYYLSNNSMKSRAFYWLLVSPNSTIPSAGAKYNSSSTTFAQDLAKATNAAHSGSKETYAFVHSVIDYLQQGEVNGYADDQWNKIVKAFAAKTNYYPSVPIEYRVFYFYPSGSASQSLMSYEGAPHGCFKVIKSSGFYSYSDTLMLCDTDSNAYYTIRNIRKAYVPIREDTCIYCGCRYWKHHKIESESERDIRFYIIQGLANDP